MGQCYDFVFSKDAEMIYISHLDLMRLFSRAARRAGLPVELTKGFNPHHQIKLKRALKLGLPSEREEGQIVLSSIMDECELKEKWQKELPKGVEILEVKK
ncbi:MAG TPA: hypothetical protein DCL35_08675 [Candidatus Omnitrophica bacterium]|nr:hypothetical protein [Candidatus Omnitrophota bacterium]